MDEYRPGQLNAGDVVRLPDGELGYLGDTDRVQSKKLLTVVVMKQEGIGTLKSTALRIPKGTLVQLIKTRTDLASEFLIKRWRELERKMCGG